MRITKNMVQLLNGVSIETETEAETDELDHVPFFLRRKLLFSRPPATNLQSSLGADAVDGGVSSGSNNLPDELDHIVLKERLRLLLQSKLAGTEKPVVEETPIEFNSSNTINDVPASRNDTCDSTLLNFIKVKDEPLDNGELHKPCMNSMANVTLNSVLVKSELNRDEVHDMQLRHRTKLHAQDSKLNSGNSASTGNVPPSSFENGPAFTEAPNPVGIIRPRKRKKTATDSIETALEEDVPGLLQVLIQQGVSIDEMKLYGETDYDEPIDESFIENGFAELEAVISKIFSQQSSFLKFATLKCAKGSKPSYCLGCLFSLVEQTRYLRFRNWPAEWGWCRDLQSFIFVFERHKRIVLERPEYGYATYFFELVESLPIDWQVKRLMTSMKLTNCGRINLIENKALVVGEDLSEGEAAVLIQFGWTPNSGLGTMLNYRDRVFHDRKNDKDSSEWRSKIGKLLMEGFNCGTIISSAIQTEFGADETPKIKVEL